MNLVFFLEEPSAREMLKGLIPRVLPDGIAFQYLVFEYLVFEGKQDLEKNIVRRMRGGLYRIVPKAALEEEIDVSHLEGKTIDGLARTLTAPVAMVRTSRRPRKK